MVEEELDKLNGRELCDLAWEVLGWRRVLMIAAMKNVNAAEIAIKEIMEAVND